ncbi:putative carbon-carbon lyase [Selenomonas ruminantium subsp. lactilytica TAM6421]|uniref:Putative carbon-carbon lyase n=1 Tax=Selenomonas ruminantium subsp. lactilytica (strain NBRC 103574 / TAM6421) TaxID=927704 RepID=I0GRR0_SELRL|nr:aldolase/citrate lyase family protein [Selenomonas ruminantium]BAL83447.1 putative carbon-carbon lyase [Selenomonas ruminantium subsp. lactilytica TAM6421]
MSLKFMYITNDPEVAKIAQKYGVDRVWVDLETLGKEERQGHIDSVKSHHSIADIKRIVPVLSTSEMLVRVNPLNPQSKDEIEQVIEAGADMIMLPMWKSLSDVKEFLAYVDGRVKTTLLLETKEAFECVDEVLAYGGIDEIHIGLNDLHLSYGLNFMFELLTNGKVEALCKKFKAAGIPYGFGGIAKIGEGAVPAEKIIMEHYRLGSTRAILSRSFCNYQKMDSLADVELTFARNMKDIKAFEKKIAAMNAQDFIQNKLQLEYDIATVANTIAAKRHKTAV